MARFCLSLSVLLVLLGCSPAEPVEPVQSPPAANETSPLVPVDPRRVGQQVDASMQQEGRQLERRVETATAEP